MRILAVIEASTISGPAKNLMSFARAAACAEPSERLEVAIVTFRRRSDTPFITALRASGLAYRIIDEKAAFDLSIVSSLRAVTKELKPDVIQTHGIKSHAAVRVAGLHRLIPWIAFNHGYTAVDFKDHLYRLVDRWSLRAARMVIAVCGPFARELERKGVRRERLRILHNSVSAFVPPDAGAVAECRTRFARGAGRLILSIGRLSSEKGQSELLDALAILHRSGSLAGIVAVVVGDGIDRARLEAQSIANGIDQHVVFAGHHGDVRPFWALADVFVLPSRSEGSPNVILEAMVAQVPIVSTAAGGVIEILENEETALVVPTRDPRALADALRRLLDDDVLRARLKTAALGVAQGRFTPEAYRRTLLGYYNEAASTDRPSK